MSKDPTNEENNVNNLELTFQNKIFSNDSSANTTSTRDLTRIGSIPSGSSTLSPEKKRFKMSTALRRNPGTVAPLILAKNYSFEVVEKTSDENFDLQSHLNLLSIVDQENVNNSNNILKKKFKAEKQRTYLSTVSNIDEESEEIFDVNDNSSKHITFKEISDRDFRNYTNNFSDTVILDESSHDPYYSGKNTFSVKNINQCDLDNYRESENTELTPRCIEVPRKKQCFRGVSNLACSTNNVVDIGRDIWNICNSSVHSVDSINGIEKSLMVLELNAPSEHSITIDRMLTKDTKVPINNLDKSISKPVLNEKIVTKNDVNKHKIMSEGMSEHSLSISHENSIKIHSSSKCKMSQNNTDISPVSAELGQIPKSHKIRNKMYSNEKPSHSPAQVIYKIDKNKPLELSEKSDPLKEFYAKIKIALPQYSDSVKKVLNTSKSDKLINMTTNHKTKYKSADLKMQNHTNSKSTNEYISSEELVNEIPSKEILEAMKNYDKMKTKLGFKEIPSKDYLPVMRNFVHTVNHRNNEDSISQPKFDTTTKEAELITPSDITADRMSFDVASKLKEFQFSGEKKSDDKLLGKLSATSLKLSNQELNSSQISELYENKTIFETFPSQKSTENILKEIKELIMRGNKDKHITIEGVDTVEEDPTTAYETTSTATQSDWTFQGLEGTPNINSSKTIKEQVKDETSELMVSRGSTIKEDYADLSKFSTSSKSPKEMSSSDIVDFVKGNKYATSAEKYFHLRSLSPMRRTPVPKFLKNISEDNENIGGKVSTVSTSVPITNQKVLSKQSSASIIKRVTIDSAGSIKSIATPEEFILLQNLSSIDCHKVKLPPIKSFSQIDVSLSKKANEETTNVPYIKKIIPGPTFKGKTKNSGSKRSDKDSENSSYSSGNNSKKSNTKLLPNNSILPVADTDKIIYLPVDDSLKEKFIIERSKPENIYTIPNIVNGNFLNDDNVRRIEPVDTIYIPDNIESNHNYKVVKHILKKKSKKLTSLSRLPVRYLKKKDTISKISTDSRSVSSKNVSPCKNVLPRKELVYTKRKVRKRKKTSTDSSPSPTSQSVRVSSINSKSTYSTSSSKQSSPQSKPFSGQFRSTSPKSTFSPKLSSIKSVPVSLYSISENTSTPNKNRKLRSSRSKTTNKLNKILSKRNIITTTQKTNKKENNDKTAKFSDINSLEPSNTICHTKLFIRVPNEEQSGNTWLQIKETRDDVNAKKTRKLKTPKIRKMTKNMPKIQDETELFISDTMKSEKERHHQHSDQDNELAKCMKTLSTDEISLSKEISNIKLNDSTSWISKRLSEKVSQHKMILGREPKPIIATKLDEVRTHVALTTSTTINHSPQMTLKSTQQRSRLTERANEKTLFKVNKEREGNKKITNSKTTAEERNRKIEQHKNAKLQDTKPIKRLSKTCIFKPCEEQIVYSPESSPESSPEYDSIKPDECRDCVTNLTDTIDDLTSTKFMQIPCEPNVLLSLPSSIQDSHSSTCNRTPLEPNIIILDEMKSSKTSPLSSKSATSIMRKYYETPEFSSASRSPTYIVSPCSTSTASPVRKKNMKDYIKSLLHKQGPATKASKEEDLVYFPEESELKFINYSDFNLPLGEMNVLPDVASTKSIVTNTAEEVFKSKEELNDLEDEVPEDFKEKIISERLSFRDLAYLSRKSHIHLKETERLHEEVHLRNKREKINIAKSRRKQVVDIKYYLFNSSIDKTEPSNSKDSKASSYLKRSSQEETTVSQKSIDDKELETCKQESINWKQEDDDIEDDFSDTGNTRSCSKMWMCFELFFPQRDPRYF